MNAVTTWRKNVKIIIGKEERKCFSFSILGFFFLALLKDVFIVAVTVDNRSF